MSSAYKWLGALLISAVLLGGWGGCKQTGDKAGGAEELGLQARELQKEQKFEEAVKVYRQVLREFPNTRDAANAQFMIGYIYANHIKDLEQAKIELNRFLQDFSANADSGLVAGAQFELQYLGKEIEEIPILAGLGSSDTTLTDTAMTETGDGGK